MFTYQKIDLFILSIFQKCFEKYRNIHIYTQLFPYQFRCNKVCSAVVCVEYRILSIPDIILETYIYILI